MVVSIVIFNVTLIILEFHCEFYCFTAIIASDFSSLLLEQNYGSTEIVVIIFTRDTPKFGGREDPVLQEIITVIVLDFSCEE